MFSKLAVFVVATMAGFVVAGDINNSCNSGPVQCCNQLFQSKSEALDYFKGVPSVIDVLVGPITGQIGAHCSPISVLAIAGNSCSSQPVCCSGNHFNGLVAAGCTPINANL